MYLRCGASDSGRGFTIPPAIRAGLLTALLLALLCVPGEAQPPSQLPDAPSAVSHADQQQASHTSAAIDLLAGRSRIFPNLAINTKPLTSGEKLELAARNSVSGMTWIGSAMAAGISQARNTRSGYGQDEGGYGKRFASSMAFVSSSNLLGTFTVASLLHEDPRFFVKNTDHSGDAVLYSTSRVVITRMDDGRSGINWAGLLGPLGGAALANTYLPADSQGVAHTFEHWGLSLAVTAGTNVLREYWPRINKKLRMPGMGIMTPSTVSSPASPAKPSS